MAKATTAIERLLALINKGEALSDQNVRYVISLVKDGEEDKLMSLSGDCVCITSKGKPVKPKTLGQKKYVEAIRKNTIVWVRVLPARVKHILPSPWLSLPFAQRRSIALS